MYTGIWFRKISHGRNTDLKFTEEKNKEEKEADLQRKVYWTPA
jgi:hypothetical protein